ncbi:FAD-binding oxidoreductase [Pseudoluteimonas lycopersici]|uniref:FAD-binding oxidoreductase n=1 Tax=Pseudoluteimonas lycopersici TaxID=1324796 RepID=A0A516V1Z0_9GAMM|nr:FAD-dependent oxidoreductase [Lysobacter lycopersici]QDQ72524.1 FAD-binding oxidoreductase [Lysobacter lycopersici]
MDLKSGYPWWAVRNGLLHAFPRLERDLRCDVAVVGGGITGALIASEFAGHGHDVVVVEERDVGWGSTAASTALLQYEIDTHLTDLAERVGEGDALLAYRACVASVEALQAMLGRMRDVGFRKSDSLYFASRRRDVRDLREEFAMRRQHGFDVRWLAQAEVRERYGFDAPAAILNRPAAGVDPYRFALHLLQALEKSGANVFDRSRVAAIEPRSRDVLLRTEAGPLIAAKHVVLAAGYATQQWLPEKVARNRSSYALIGDPLDPGPLDAFRRTMAWDTARPYLYFRITPDNRLLVGGEDDAVDIPARRDRRVPKKAAKLLKRMHALFPDAGIVPAFSWAGTFAETEDGLPFFGPHRALGPRVHYAMAYGGNGITYSMLGAGLLRALVERTKHPLAKLFSFARVGAD